MRKLLTILFSLLVVNTQAAQVYFNLQNFTTLPVQNKTFRMVPVTTAVTSGGATAIGEPFTTNTGTGVFYISNVVANSYDCTVITPVRPTTFRILVPDTTDVVDSSSARDTASAVTGTYDTTASDARYLSSSATNNLIPKKDGIGTNLTLYQSGGKGLSLAAGASITMTNGSLTVKSNGFIMIGDNTGTANLRFQIGAYVTDYTTSEQWNFKTASAGGSDSATVARLIDLTNTPNPTQFRSVGLASVSISDGAALTNIVHTGSLTNNGPTGLGGAVIIKGGVTNLDLAGGFYPIVSDSNKKLVSATAMQFSADGNGYAASNTIRWAPGGVLSIDGDFSVLEGQNALLSNGDANFRGGAVLVRSGPVNNVGAIVLLGNGDSYFSGNMTNQGTYRVGTNPPSGVVISMPPMAPNSSNGNYNFARETTKFNPLYPNDETLTIGMNQLPGGAKQNAQSAALWLQWENGYTGTGTTSTWSEFHLDFSDLTNHYFRPWGITMDWLNLGNIIESETVSQQLKYDPITGSNYFRMSPYQMNWMSSTLNYTNGITISSDAGTVSLAPYVAPGIQALGLGAWPIVYLPGATTKLGGWDLSADMYQISTKLLRFYGNAGGDGGIELKGDQGASLGTNAFVVWSAGRSSDTPVSGLWGTSGLIRVTAGRNNTTIGSLDASNATFKGSVYVTNQLQVQGGASIVGVNVTNNGTLSFSTNLTAADTFLQRGMTAGTLDQRNGTSPQTNALYNSFTDSGNREWMENAWDANILYVGRQKRAGAGSARSTVFGGGNGDTYLDSGSSNTKYFRRGNTVDWQISTAGAFMAGTDGGVDIGVTNANRPATLFLSRGLVVGASGSYITNVLTGRAVLDFPNTSAQSSADLSIAVTGATTNDVATVAAPPVAQLPNSSYSCFASNDTVWVRFNNYSTGALNPGAASFSVKVDRF